MSHSFMHHDFWSFQNFMQLFIALSSAAVAAVAGGSTRLVGSGAVIAQGGYPRAIEASSGERFLCTGAESKLLVFASPVNATLEGPWAPVGVVLEDGRAGVDLANCVLFEVVPGVLLASYRYHTGCPVVHKNESLRSQTLGNHRSPNRGMLPLKSPRAHCANFSIQVSQSSDGGRHWTYLSTVTSGPIGMWEPFFFQTAAGVQIAYSQELSNGGLQSIVWQLSRDHGQSWGVAVTISNGQEHASRDGMPGLARLPDNSIVVVFEGFWAHGPGRFSVQMRRSRDDGVTWDSGKVIFSTATPASNAGAPQVTVANGTVWVSFMCDEDISPAQRSWPGDAATKVMYTRATPSELDFADGRDRMTVGVGPGALWPGLVTVTDQAIALFGRGGSSYLKTLVAGHQ